jgi:ADP-heptose:LPS heptosyltransferase
MHIVESKSGIDLGQLCQLPAGSYYVEDLNAADIMSLSPRGETALTHVKNFGRTFSEDRDWNGKKILLVRPGGFGDLLFLTPSVAEMKRRWPSCEIHVSAFARYQSILRTSQVDSIVGYPLSVQDVDLYDAVVFLENVIEGNPDAETLHAVDVVAKKIGLSDLASKKMQYEFTPDEVEWSTARYPRTDARRVAIQISASGHARNYPGNLLTEVIGNLIGKGIEVFLLGHPGEVPGKTPKGIRNLTLEGLSFRQSVAAMATCDMVLGPDSVMIHIAGAIDMPALGLYGPFPWKLRTAYAPSVRALQGTSGCAMAPCFFHGSRLEKHFPKAGPCAKSNRCEVMASIEPKRVLASINSILEESKVHA